MRKLLVGLVVLALVGLGADRVAHRVATDEAESRLAAEGLSAASVEVGGFPFLNQLLRRQFDEVQVRGSALRTEGWRARGVSATAYDVDAVAGGPVTAGRLSARGTVTYAEVLRQVGVPGLTLRDAGDGRVRLGRGVTVLGRTFAATALGSVEPRGRRLVVVPTTVELGNGTAIDDAATQALLRQFSVDYRLADLPRGLTVRRIVPADNGFVVTLGGRDVSLDDVS